MGKESNSRTWGVVAILLALGVIAAVSGRYIYVFSSDVIYDQEKWGQFGDYFGGVLNPILSFFAFTALIVTLRVQLSANQDSDRRHTEQLREQRLFQLVSLLSDNAVGIKTVAQAGANTVGYAQGRQALHHAAMTLRDSLSTKIRISSQINTDDKLEVFNSVEESFRKWRKNYWSAVGVYLESVFLTLHFILESESSTNFKQFSLSLLKAQLSESERLLLWYTAMFTAKYSIYLTPLLASGFVDDSEDSLDDQIKPWREDLIRCSLLWSNTQKQPPV